MTAESVGYVSYVMMLREIINSKIKEGTERNSFKEENTRPK
jgi:hypothetical protein